MKKNKLIRFFIRAHWIESVWVYTDAPSKRAYDCSVCHETAREQYNFCPSCGAKMKSAKVLEVFDYTEDTTDE